jgi:hypothetical protein
MWDPQRITTLRASMASYGDSFTFYPLLIVLLHVSITETNEIMLCSRFSLYVSVLRLFIVKWCEYWRIGKDLEVNICGQIEILFLHLPRDWGKLRKACQDSTCSDRRFYQAPPLTLMLSKELILNTELCVQGLDTHLTHFPCVPDAPSDSVYIVCGVLIAMVLVAAIIILLAVFIRSVCQPQCSRRSNSLV